jgi:hypothetical protein
MNRIDMKRLKTGRARVIKISKEALFEFIYEKFIEEQSQLLEVEPTEVADRFELNFADGDFIFAAYRYEDPEGNFLSMPGQIDLRKVMKNIPDTTPSMFSPIGKLYREYTFDELIGLSESDGGQSSDRD